MRIVSVLLIASGVLIAAYELLRRWNNQHRQERERLNHEQYLKRFREGQRTCDEAFKNLNTKSHDKRLNIWCKNPALEPVFWR